MYFYQMTQFVHIGQAIEDRIKELKLIKRRVAEDMAMTPQNLNSIFRSPTIRTDTLEKFCKLLDKNFFLLYRGLNKSDESPSLEESNRKIEIILNDDGTTYDTPTNQKLEDIYDQVNQIKEEIKELMELKAIARHLNDISERLDKATTTKKSEDEN